MRVIAGEFRRRVLKSLPGLEIRPTPDRMREALFNVLSPQIEGAVFVDAYAGTGAVGIEALSRGARKVVLIENDRLALQVIEENLRMLKALGRVQIVKGKAAVLAGRYQADIVFADPPYPLEKEYVDLMTQLGAVGPPLAIVQHASRFQLEETYGLLHRTRVLKQGDNSLSFFAPQDV